MGKKRDRDAWLAFIGRALPVLVLAAGAIYVFIHWGGLGTAPVVDKEHHLWDQILGTPEVALGLRLALVAGATYVAASVVGLAVQGRWITKVGKEGVETDPAIPLEQLQSFGQQTADRVGKVEQALEMAAQGTHAMVARVERLERAVAELLSELKQEQ